MLFSFLQFLIVKRASDLFKLRSPSRVLHCETRRSKHIFFLFHLPVGRLPWKFLGTGGPLWGRCNGRVTALGMLVCLFGLLLGACP